MWGLPLLSKATDTGQYLKAIADYSKVIGTELQTDNFLAHFHRGCSYNEPIISNVTDVKKAISISTDGTNYNSMGENNSVFIQDNKLVISLDAPLSGNRAQVKIAPGTIKDLRGNILTSKYISPAIAIEGCFIATAAFGSYLDHHVGVLRQFRDRVLLKSGSGRWLVAEYYYYSPPIAAIIASHPGLRLGTRKTLTPLVYAIEYPRASVGLLLLLIAGLLTAFKNGWKLQIDKE